MGSDKIGSSIAVLIAHLGCHDAPRKQPPKKAQLAWPSLARTALATAQCGWHSLYWLLELSLGGVCAGAQDRSPWEGRMTPGEGAL